MIRFWSVLLLGMASFAASGQTFVNFDLNRIEHPAKLQRFYNKLQQLKSGERRRVNVVHIGDSHIQCGLMTAPLRRSLQKEFGNAGRGLVFPYKLANTHGPVDVRSFSTEKWQGKRNVFPNQPMPIGVCGMSAEINDKDFIFKLGIRPNDSLDYSFDQVTLFHHKGPDAHNLHLWTSDSVEILESTQQQLQTISYKVQRGDYLGKIAQQFNCSLSDLMRWNNMKTNVIYAGQTLQVNANLAAPKPIDESVFEPLAVLHNKTYGAGHFHTNIKLSRTEHYLLFKNTATKGTSRIYGAVMQQSKASGLLFHMIGVNGAQFEHYNQSAFFLEQLEMLKPDLIIISLGTNENLANPFNAKGLRSSSNEFIQDLQAILPQADILVTTPPDNKRKVTQYNAHAKQSKQILKDVASVNNCAIWDLHEIMGGEGSMEKWVKSGLAQRDRVHFTAKGYAFQADLLFEAIMKATE